MEYTLRVDKTYLIGDKSVVLILVLMEYTLRVMVVNVSL